MSKEIENKSLPSVEYRTLVVMRRVLSSVVREITPPPGMRHPLSAQTIEDIKHCFSLIAAREREIRSDNDHNEGRKPVYSDQVTDRQFVEFKPNTGDK